MSTPEIETAPAMAREMRYWAGRCEQAGDATRLELGAEMIDRLYALLMSEGECQPLELEVQTERLFDLMQALKQHRFELVSRPDHPCLLRDRQSEQSS